MTKFFGDDDYLFSDPLPPAVWWAVGFICLALLAGWLA